MPRPMMINAFPGSVSVAFVVISASDQRAAAWMPPGRRAIVIKPRIKRAICRALLSAQDSCAGAPTFLNQL